MSLKSRREERKAVEVLKAAGLDVTKPDLIDQLVNGGTVSYQPNGSVSYLNTFKQSYARMYTTQAAFRSVVDFLSRNVGGIHMKLSERQGDAQIPRPDHDFQTVVDHPSPGVSYSKLMTAIVADRSIYGTYAVWKIRENFSPTPNSQGFVPNSGKVVGLVRIPIPYISIQKLSLTAPLMFQFTAGTNIKIRPEDMIWGTLYDPVMPVGISPKQITFDAQDQQYLQMRNFTREEVCHAFGFNPALLGITPSNFASADSFHQQLYQDTLTPICVGIQEDFEEQLLYPDFVGNDYDFAIDFNINAKLQGSFLEQAKIGQQAVGGPWMTMNEFRQKFQGLPPIPDGDQIIVPLNVVRGGGAQANPQDAQNQFTTTNKAGLQLLAGEE
jgi:hypothetical protein